MLQTVPFIVLACVVQAAPEESQKIAAVIRNVYEENRAALATHGSIRFRVMHGNLGAASGFKEANRLLRADWNRLSHSKGQFIFDGPNRRYENIYPTEEEVSLRTKTSATTATSPIFSTRLLTDGETALKDNVNVSPEDDQTELHNPSCTAGTKVFFRFAQHLPLALTDPDPSWSDLGACLRDLMESRGRLTLAEVDEKAKLDGIPVVKLTIEGLSPRRRIEFWVDLEHGAIPLQGRWVEGMPGESVAAWGQQNCSDIRWVEKGWLPFRQTIAWGDLKSNAGPDNVPSDGVIPALLVRETIVDEADFRESPNPALFVLEFPREFNVNDSDRHLSYGRRSVWTLRDFSPAARARARPINVRSSLPAPAMPEAREAPRWWPAVLLLLGLTCLLGVGALLFQRSRSHAT